MENNKDDRQFQYAMHKNKPRVLFPIINTILAIGIATFLLVLAIREKQSFWVYIVIFVFVIVFPLSSWYNSYFSKKHTRIKIYNVQEETNLMMEYTKHLHPRTKYLLNEESHLDFTIDYINPSKCLDITFNAKTKEFEPLLITDERSIALLSLGVSFAGLGINTYTKKVIGVMGFVPASIWIKKRLTIPVAKEGSLNVDFKDFSVENKVLFQYRKKEDIYYDAKKGWLCFGEKKLTPLDEAVKIGNDAIAVIREKDLISLWVLVGQDIN